MTADEIKAEISAGHIGAITLDTSAFGKPSEMSLEHGLLPRLEQFRGSAVRFVLSDIVANEVQAHMRKGAAEALSLVDRSLRNIGGAWGIEKEKRAEARAVLVGEETPEGLTRKRLDHFLNKTGCTVIKAEEHVAVSELMCRYFENAAPFAEKDTKKNEFPDALALLCLESWAKAADTKILVVSNDDDWVRYCDDSERLVVVRELADALSYFHANASVACNLLSQILNSGTRPEWSADIRRVVESHIEGMDFMPEADSVFRFDDEITELWISDCSIGDGDDVLRPVDFGEDFLVAEVQVVADVDITCDFSFYVKDGIDKDNVPMGSASITRRESVELTVILTFGGKIPDAPELDDIEVQGNSYYIRFGHVEPDWMNDPSNYEE